MPVLQVRLSDEQAEHLASIAETEGLSLSEFARSLLFEERDAMRFSDELREWMQSRAESKGLSLQSYVELVMDNVRRQWVAQQQDPKLKVRAVELAVAGARENPRKVEQGA